MQPISRRATEQKGWLYREDCPTAFPGTAFRLKCQLCLSSRPLDFQLRPPPSRLMVLRPAERLSILTRTADLVTCQLSKGMRQFLTLNQFHALVLWTTQIVMKGHQIQKNSIIFLHFQNLQKKSIQYFEWCSNLQWNCKQHLRIQDMAQPNGLRTTAKLKLVLFSEG